jgi:hypothetical protein
MSTGIRFVRALGVLGALGLAGCMSKSSPSGSPRDLASVVVPSESFTFATSRAVSLRLEPTATRPEDAKLVRVTDSEGHRLFQGVVLAPLALELQLSNATSDTLTVTTGRGEASASQTVTLEARQGAVRF